MKHTKSDNELMQKTDAAISELVYPKYKLQKAYNYYNGIRDAEQFRYLEENFGLGNPTSIEFTPLIRKHVDALVGEYLETPIIPKVSCKDSETISNITREKEIEISREVFEYLQRHAKNSLLNFVDGRDITDRSIEQQLDKLIEDIDMNFISQYEIAAQNVIEYIMQSRNTDIITKLRQLLTDLLITGYTFYRVKKSVEGNNVDIEVLNPLNTFIDRNPESIYIKNSYRVVVRKWMNKHQILNLYGREMSEADRKEIKDLCEDGFNTSTYYVRSFADFKTGEPLTDGLDAGKEVVPGYPDMNIQGFNYRLHPVYEVEWLEVDKDYNMQRYETIRIGENIYILRGKVDAIRTKDNPTYCGLSVNGVYFNNRNSEPYSLVLACVNLQDKYDLLHFYRDNLIANSGTSGDWLDLSMLPTSLGVELPERIQKWIAYKKGGVALVDTSQEGRGFNNNTSFAGFDDTISSQTIQAIELAIERIENTASSITGVFRERLNGINQKDAVSNVQLSVNNSFTITKQYYQQMDLITNEMLIDCLNIAKIVWKEKPLTGTLILGDKFQKIFTALPKYFTFTDYDIHIITTSTIMREMELIKSIMPQFIESGTLDPDIIIDALTAKSMTELKYKVQNGFKKRKEENENIQQIQQAYEEAQQQLQQLQQQNQEMQAKIEQLNEAKLQLEQQKLQMQTEIDWYLAKSDRASKENIARNNDKRTEIEVMQMHDGNPYNNKVRQI